MLLIPLKIDITSGWDTLWNTLKTAFPALPVILGFVAIIMLVLAIIMWVWGKRNNVKAGNNQALLGALIVAALFAGPDVVFPLLLWVGEGLINFVVSLVTTWKNM